MIFVSFQTKQSNVSCQKKLEKKIIVSTLEDRSKKSSGGENDKNRKSI